jgi:AraC family transcriptional regulator
MDTQIIPSEVRDFPVSSPLDTKRTLATLLATASAVLDTDSQAAKACIQRAATVLGIDFGPQRGATAERLWPRGGLVPWQAKRIRSHIEDNLDSSIRANDLARIAKLSPRHFFRSFRKTFGETPLAYVTRRRIRRAKELMVTSQLSLSQVALECGLSDQAHLSRVFRRVVGTNPNAWRRLLPVTPAAPRSAGQPESSD